MKTIVLNGQLGKQFGRRHYFDVATAAEAVRALVANFPAVEKHLMNAKCLGYRVKLHDAPVMNREQLHHPVGGSTITFTPVLSGAKKQGVGQIITGAILVAAAVIGNVFFPGNPVSPYLMNAGIAMIIGGTAQMLSPTPKSDDPSERPENKPSYAFNGPINTTAQGHPVPVGYGRLIVGGAVISAGISTEEFPYDVDFKSLLDAFFGKL